MKLRETTHCPNCECLAQRLARMEEWSFEIIDRVDCLEEEAARLRQENEKLRQENALLRKRTRL